MKSSALLLAFMVASAIPGSVAFVSPSGDVLEECSASLNLDAAVKVHPVSFAPTGLFFSSIISVWIDVTPLKNGEITFISFDIRVENETDEAATVFVEAIHPGRQNLKRGYRLQVSAGSEEETRGYLPMPDGFEPFQARVRVCGS